MPARASLLVLFLLAAAPFVALHADLRPPGAVLPRRVPALRGASFAGVTFALTGRDGSTIQASAASLALEAVGRVGFEKSLVAHDVRLESVEGTWHVESLELGHGRAPWRWTGDLRYPLPGGGLRPQLGQSGLLDLESGRLSVLGG